MLFGQEKRPTSNEHISVVQQRLVEIFASVDIIDSLTAKKPATQPLKTVSEQQDNAKLMIDLQKAREEVSDAFAA